MKSRAKYVRHFRSDFALELVEIENLTNDYLILYIYHRLSGEDALKKALKTAKFEEMKNRTFEVIGVTERLCELCDGIIDTKELLLRSIQISDRRDYENLLTRSKVYDRAEVDLENRRVYFYNHDYPGDVHPSCIQKL